MVSEDEGNFFKSTVICMCVAGIQTIARCWNSEDCTAPIPLNSFEPPFVTTVDRCPDHERAECIGVGGSGGCRPGDIEFLGSPKPCQALWQG